MGSDSVASDDVPVVVDAGPSVDAPPAGDAGPARAKTLAELMADMKANSANADGGTSNIDAGTASAPEASSAPTTPSKPKTMAELMADMKAKQAAEASADAGP